MSVDAIFLKRALSLAKTYQGRVAPNPAVGAVIVAGGEEVASGAHRRFGGLHAEAEALQRCPAVDNLTMYVTLEPCCHTGKQGPCTDLILAHPGIKRVVYAYRDPNPKVSGRGHELLEQAGLEVLHHPLSSIDDFYRPYAQYQCKNQPYLIGKMALSLDGKIARRANERTPLSNESSRRYVHRLRRSSDAILTTTKTLAIDDPQLNVRLAKQAIAKPVLVLGNTPVDPQATIHQTASVIHELRGSAPLTAEHLQRKIYALGYIQVMVEAGAQCMQWMLNEQLLDELHLIVCPQILGDAAYPMCVDSVDLMARAKKWYTRSSGCDTIYVFKF